MNNKPIYRFRINYSIHSDTDPRTLVNTIYHKGSVFESTIELDKEFNTDPAKPKFTRVDNSVPLTYNTPTSKTDTAPTPKVETNESSTNKDDTLSSMTVEELRQYALSEEIDLGKAKTKAEILAIIREVTED